jgi:ADP-ribosyl-[dinitrogen reductase] hydrolase
MPDRAKPEVTANADNALPLPNTYWVVPGVLLAGEHPGGEGPEETRERVQKLVGAGVQCFIDLTHPNELDAYDHELPIAVDYMRKPIRDHGLPARPEHMIDIQACIDHALRSGMLTYIHCRAGIGRTGMVVGCFLVERGMSGEEALDELNRVWQQCKRSASWPHVPETDDQSAFVRNWKPQVASMLRQRVAAPATTPLKQRVAAPPSPPPKRRAVAPAEAPLESVAREPEDPLLDNSALSAARSLRERFLGALVGLAVGDALAAATQFRNPGSFSPVGDLLGGGPFDLPRGAWSDDTSMALCLAESLLEATSFDPRDQVERYRRWQQHGYLSATGQCLGITASTSKALAQAGWRRQLFSGSHDPNQLDPEVLSRVAPIVMFYFADANDAVNFASEQSRTTCQAPAATEACKVLAASVYAALAGKPKAAVLSPGPDLLDVPSLRTGAAKVAQSAGHVSTPRAGNVLESLEAAFWAFHTTDNFRDGALKAANLGSNSDVAAAAYGQLAGAHYGLGAIPATWRTSLMGKDLIEGLADRLLTHAMVGLAG